MTTTTTVSARSFFFALRGAKSRQEEVPVIAEFRTYSLGEPHGSQLDAARYAARRALDPSMADPETRVGQVVQELSQAERVLLRRWRNYSARAKLVRQELRDLNAEILETTELGNIPDLEQCARRAQLVEELEFWQRRADNPQNFPIEREVWKEGENPLSKEELESLVKAQKRDIWAEKCGQTGL